MDEQLSIYRVEISGWDFDEQFFVERAALEWREGEQKRVFLHRRTRPGGLLFLRLLENSSPSTSFPVAYRVREVHERDRGTAYEVILHQIWPTPQGPNDGATARLDAARSRRLGLN
jgi:hypothetical protein